MKLKRNASRTRTQSIKLIKTICQISRRKNNRSKKRNSEKDEKPLYKVKENVVYGKTMENLRNNIDVRLASSKKDYLKWTSNPRYMSQRIFDNNLVAILKRKVNQHMLECAY